MSVLSFSAVSKSFGARAALCETDVRFEAGQITAIVGRSGCGKSTLLKLANGLVVPDSGQVSAFGEPVDYSALPQLRRRMGYAVQGTGLFPHMTARDNIALAAAVAGWSETRINERVEELLSLTHLSAELLPSLPHELSGGQQQRVGLCRAMMLRPEVLLLDEPFAAIDPLTRFDIHEQLLEILAAEPATVLLVTHDMREAMLLGDRILLMDAGRIHRDDSRDDLSAALPGLEPEALLRALMQELPS